MEGTDSLNFFLGLYVEVVTVPSQSVNLVNFICFLKLIDLIGIVEMCGI